MSEKKRKYWASLCFHATYHGIWVFGFFSQRFLNLHQSRIWMGVQAGDVCGVVQIPFLLLLRLEKKFYSRSFTLAQNKRLFSPPTHRQKPLPPPQDSICFTVIFHHQEWCSCHTIIKIPAWLERQDTPVMDGIWLHLVNMLEFRIEWTRWYRTVLILKLMLPSVSLSVESFW